MQDGAAVLRFDAQGQIVWQRLLTNTGGIFETVTSLSTAANGDLLLAGTLDKLSGFGSTGYLARMSPRGEIEGCDLLEVSSSSRTSPGTRRSPEMPFLWS